MEKIKINQQQANSIESALRNNEWSKDDLMRIHVKNYNTGYESWGYPWGSLNNLDASEMAKALYIGYEVDEEFKIGDWVSDNLAGDVAKVTRKYPNSIHCDNGMGGYIKGFRHATVEEIAQEKERRIDKKLDRLLADLSHEEQNALAERFL